MNDWITLKFATVNPVISYVTSQMLIIEMKQSSDMRLHCLSRHDQVTNIQKFRNLTI